MRYKTTVLLTIVTLVVAVIVIGCSSGGSSIAGGGWTGLAGASATVNYATLTGIVTDQNGKFVENVYVRILSATMITETAVTDSTGRYQISVPAGKYNATVQKSGYDAVSQNLDLKENEITVFSTVIIAQVPAVNPISANLIGSVLLNTTGELLANISVKLYKSGELKESSITTPEGKFIFQSQLAGMYEISLAENSASYNPATYVVHILNDGTLSPLSPKLYLSTKILGEDTTLIYHALATGSVYDAFTKAPLQYVTCTVKGVGSTVSDLKGYFEFKNLLPGTYDLTLARDGWSTLTTNFTVRYTDADPLITEILPSPLSFMIAQSPEIDRGSIAGRYVDEATGNGVNDLIVRVYTFKLVTQSITVGGEEKNVTEWTLFDPAPIAAVSTRTGPGSVDFVTAGSFRIEHLEPSTLAKEDPSQEVGGYVVYVGTGDSKLNTVGSVWNGNGYNWWLPDPATPGIKHIWSYVKVKPNTTTYLHNYDNPYKP